MNVETELGKKNLTLESALCIVFCVPFTYFSNTLYFLEVISEGTLPQIRMVLTVANGIEKAGEREMKCLPLSNSLLSCIT
jgi:hypothetical protein